VRSMDRLSTLTESRDEIYFARANTINEMWPTLSAEQKTF